jgi:hypothetical protein
MPNMSNLNLGTVRWVALIGLGVVLVSDLVVSLPWKPRQGYGLVLLVFACAVVALVSLILMPRAAGALVRHKDLLIPLALLVVALQLLAWLTALPLLGALLTPAWPLHLFNWSFALSLHLLITIGLFIAYATWMTAAILAFVRTGQNNPCAVWPAAVKQFWRVFGLEIIGVTVVLLGTGALLALLPVFGWLALVPMAAFAVAWNFATAAVLPVAFDEELGFWAALRAGVQVSLVNLRKWWLLLLAHMLLLGLFIFFYSRWNEGGTQHANVSWHVNVFWTGGYEDGCRWYGKLVDVYKTSKLPFVETLLGLLFGAMAVAVKIAVVQRLQGKASADVPPLVSVESVVDHGDQKL